jgi:hypothetical protein
MRKLSRLLVAASVGVFAAGWVALEAASAADMPEPEGPMQGPPPGYGYGPPPVQQGYGYPPPAAYGYPPPPVVYYDEAPPPVVVVPGPYYYGREAYIGGYGPRYGHGYGHWHGHYRHW